MLVLTSLQEGWLQVLVVVLLLSSVPVQGLPLQGKDSCSTLQLTRPEATTAWGAPGWSSLRGGNKLNLTNLLVNGADITSLALEQALRAQESAGDKPCTVTSYPLGGGSAKRKGCGTFNTADHKGATDGLCIRDDHGQPLAFLLTKQVWRTMCLCESVTVEVSCHLAQQHCYTLSLTAPQSDHVLRKRSVRDVRSEKDVGVASSKGGMASHSMVVGMAVGVVFLVAMVTVIALCAGGGDKYDPAQGKGGSRKMSARDEVAEQPARESARVEVTPPPEDTTPVNKETKTNGTGASGGGAGGANPVALAGPVPSRDRESGKSKTESVGQLSVSSGGKEEQQERARTLSARSFDPLPEVPKLEPPEDVRGNKAEGGDTGSYDEDDDPYVEVPGENEERMKESDSDEEENEDRLNADAAKPPAGATPIPPYGKVSRHVGKPPSDPSDPRKDDEEEDNDSYAEVRDVVNRRPLLLSSQRDRSQTDPVNPANLGAGMREKRALTESTPSATHMPLPDIPASGLPQQVIAEESEMYDSILETERKKPASPPAPKKKERLYESVDEMAEKDLYESVPDSLANNVESPVSPRKVSAPATLSPVQAETPPMPPSSPIPSNKNQPEQGKKKNIEKTLSAANTQHEEKRRFSFFRKKTSSVSSRPTASSKHPPHPKSPTSVPAAASTSPQHKTHHHHLPNFPAPPRPDQAPPRPDQVPPRPPQAFNEDEEEEDTYDKVVTTPGSAPLEPSEMFQQGLSNTAKAMSLPMTYRTGATHPNMPLPGAGHPNVPLPKLPEDSGSGTVTVQHKRVMESGEGPDDYDMVHRDEYIPDEPNYDTVQTDIVLKPRRDDGVDPPYDRIDKQELQEFREKEKQARDALSPQRSDRSPSRSTLEGASGLPPDHDEEGYAVVPEEIRMRKRAMSESQGVHVQKAELSPTSVAAGYHLVQHHHDEQGYREARAYTMTTSPQRSVSGGNIEEQYATVNISAKKGRKERELEEMLREQEELKGYREEGDARLTSPDPPPLPPAPKPEDVEEFQQPPIPVQSEGVHMLLEGARIDTSGDPPYAKVRNKTDNPYAEVTQPYAEVDVTQLQSQALAKKAARGAVPSAEGGVAGVSDNVQDEAAGYDVIGTLGVRSKVKPYDTIENVQGEVADNAMDEAAGYDVIGTVGVKTKVKDKPYSTIQDVRPDMTTATAPNQLEQEMPKLDTAESPEGNIYDSLLPESPSAEDAAVPEPKSKVAPRSMV